MKLIGKLKKKISLNHIQGFDSLFRANLTNAIKRVRTFNKTIDHIVEMEDNTDSLLFGDISPCQVETVARLTVDLLISLTVTRSEVKRIENDLGRYCFVFTKKLLNDANINTMNFSSSSNSLLSPNTMSYTNMLHTKNVLSESSYFNTKSTLLPSSLSTNNMIKLSSKINTSNLKSKIELIDSAMSDEYYSTLSNYPTKRDDIFKEKLKVRSISKNIEEVNAFTQKMLKSPNWGTTTYSNRVHSFFKRPAKGNTSREVDHNIIGFIPRLRKSHFKIKEII